LSTSRVRLSSVNWRPQTIIATKEKGGIKFTSLRIVTKYKNVPSAF